MRTMSKEDSSCRKEKCFVDGRNQAANLAEVKLGPPYSAGPGHRTTASILDLEPEIAQQSQMIWVATTKRIDGLPHKYRSLANGTSD